MNARIVTVPIDMDEFVSLNRDRTRLQMAERIWQAVCPGESLIEQCDALLERNADPEFVAACGTEFLRIDARENAPGSRN